MVTVAYLSDSHTTTHVEHRAGPFDYIVLRCLEKQPTKRYQTFDGLVTDLEEAYRQLTGVTDIRHRQDESTSTTYDYSMDRATVVYSR
jgi:hypothetical protein